MMYLDAQHRLIAIEDLFRGTLAQTRVYLREIACRALHHNAGCRSWRTTTQAVRLSRRVRMKR